jgi:hypothetical protein
MLKTELTIKPLSKSALLGWEYGANLGHITVMLSDSLGLKQRGWQCIFALRNASQAHAF